jgi:prevent-host-death family protein
LTQYSTSDLSRKSGDITAEALCRPVTITQRNKPRLVLLSIEDYRKLTTRAHTTGCVIRFPLFVGARGWRGETEGRMPRPVAVGVRIGRPKGVDLLVLFPITSQSIRCTYMRPASNPD